MVNVVFFGGGEKKLEQLSKSTGVFSNPLYKSEKWPVISSIYFWGRNMFDPFPEDPWDERYIYLHE